MTYNIPDRVLKEISLSAQEHDIRKVILFGSRARGSHTERSDIDIAVSGVKDFSALEEEIEMLPTLYKIDTVNLDTCRNMDLMEDIQKYGKKIYEKI